MSYTPLDEIPKIHSDLVETFQTELTYPIAWRQHQLLQVARLCQENAEAFHQAEYADLGRPALETYGLELAAAMDRAVLIAKNLPAWAKPEDRNNASGAQPEWQADWKPRIVRRPKGVVLIIAPWNYPIILSLQPMLHAIAAGNCVVLKPSEVAPAVAKTLAELIPKYLDPKAFRVICGGVEETTKVLELKWDHIFYTGNSTVGRIVSAAAAKHLTPITLELGGKSPVIIDPSHPDIDLVARRIMFGKISNSGQLCVSPDYALVPSPVLSSFIDALKRTSDAFFGQDGGALSSKSFSRIVNAQHFKRVTSLLKATKGKVVMGGKYEEKTDENGKWWGKIEPTAVLMSEEQAKDDALMQGEIFGPILVLVEVQGQGAHVNGAPKFDGLEYIAAACKFTRTKDHSLVIYTFTDREEVKEYVREHTTSGNCVFNDTFMQLASHEIPFGGVGESGHGRYIMKTGFEEFSYSRSELDIPRSAEKFLGARYPPYTKEKFEFMSAMVLDPNVLPKTTPEGGLNV